MAQPLRFFALPLCLVCLGITSFTLSACSDDEGGGSKGKGDGGADAGTGGSSPSAGGRAAGGSASGGAGGAQGGSGGAGGAGDGGGATGGAAPEGGVEGGTEGGVEGGTEGGDASPPPPPTAFRMTELVLHDPVPALEAQDACNSVLGAINGLIASNFTGDAPVGDAGVGDGELDLSFVMVHRPLLQSGSGNATFYQAACTSPAAGTTCSPKASLPGLPYTVTNQASGTCLEPDTANVTPGNGPVVPATAGANGCMASSSETFALALGPVDLVFDSARIGAQWVGDPATGMIEGIFVGFLSQARVNQIVLPPELGSFALSTAFPTGSAAVNCTDEIDVGPDGTTPGWWWHLNFRAEAVGWSE